MKKKKAPGNTTWNRVVLYLDYFPFLRPKSIINLFYFGKYIDHISLIYINKKFSRNFNDKSGVFILQIKNISI